MSAALDKLEADLAACHADIMAPGFRCRTEADHLLATRRDLANVARATLGGEPLPEPPLGPPSEESQAAVAELLADIRRLEADAADLRSKQSRRR
jgi:hypothetical protein